MSGRTIGASDNAAVLGGMRAPSVRVLRQCRRCLASRVMVPGVWRSISERDAERALAERWLRYADRARRRGLFIGLLLGLLLGALAVHAVHAASRPQSTAPLFRDVQVPAATVLRDPPSPTAPNRAASTPGLILDPAAPTTAVSRPAVAPTAAPIVVLRPTPRPKVTGSVTGTASWYDYVSGGAAAGAALRNAMGPNWRGKYVVVCATSCITVKLSDWMANPNAVIDLDDASFAALAPLSAGVVSVRVSW